MARNRPTVERPKLYNSGGQRRPTYNENKWLTWQQENKQTIYLHGYPQLFFRKNPFILTIGLQHSCIITDKWIIFYRSSMQRTAPQITFVLLCRNTIVCVERRKHKHCNNADLPYRARIQYMQIMKHDRYFH